MTEVAAAPSLGTGVPRTAELLPIAELRKLSERSGLRASVSIATQWLVIAVAIWGALALGTWWAYLAAIVVVATRQHALAVLMHDGSHYLLARNRRLNDVASDLLLAFPIFLSTRRYRKHHLTHHRNLNDEGDPDLDLESRKRPPLRWVGLFLCDVLGLTMLKTLRDASDFSIVNALLGDREARRVVGRGHLVLFVGFALAVAVALTLLHAWTAYLLLWLVPSLTVLNFILRVRAVAEHVGVSNGSEISASRTVVPNPFERALFSPCNINYHLAHHLFPSVPSYSVKRLHERLMQDERYRREAPVTTSYLVGRRSVLGEILAQRS